MTLATFNKSGKIPVDKVWFMISEIGAARQCEQVFNNLREISSCPLEFLD